MKPARPRYAGARFASVVVACCVAACGGSGGGSDGTGSSAVGPGGSAALTAFPLRAAYKSFLVNGYAQTFTVSGDCAGTAIQRSSTPIAATFQGASAVAVVTESSFTLPNCGTPVTGSASVQYFDADYRALGGSTPGFARYETPFAMPDLVRVGDSATLGTELFYTDTTQSVATGKLVLSYAILADTATSVLTRFTTQTYDTSEHLLSTQMATYRLGFDASFKVLSIESFYPDSGVHLLLTPPP